MSTPKSDLEIAQAAQKQCSYPFGSAILAVEELKINVDEQFDGNLTQFVA